MPSKWEQPLSDGVTELNYEFGLRPLDAPKLNSILNAAAKTYHLKCGGVWTTKAMEPFCDDLAVLLFKHRSITNRMFRSGDPLLQNLIKRALEILPSKLAVKRGSQ